MRMKKRLNILIADRNARIRDFLKREMTAEGYAVGLADNGNEVIRSVYADDTLDLLILDPEIFCPDEHFLHIKLENRIPSLPLILHVSPSEVDHLCAFPHVTAVVEKGWNSVEALKSAVKDFEKHHVEHIRIAEGAGHV
jgi:DNA-binding NtrC family response regulator